MPRTNRRAKRKSRSEKSFHKDLWRLILKVLAFAAMLIGGAMLVWNDLDGPHRTGRFLTLGNLGFFLIGVSGLRLLMLLFPNWSRKQSEKPDRKRTRFGGHWGDWDM